MKPAAGVAALFLTLVAVAHALRLLFRLELTVGGANVPLWVSGVAVLATGGLAFWLWREGEERPRAG